MSRSRPDDDGPLERYLDEVVAAWTAGRPRELRYLLAETEAHLREDTARAVASGMSTEEAETEAVRRFGPAHQLVTADRHRTTTPFTVLARQLVATTALLGGIGALAVGASGVVAAAIRWLAGAPVLAGPQPGQTLAPADCARWLSQNASASSCKAAATADWADEVVFYRLFIGVLGAITLLVLLRLSWRRTNRAGRPTLLPSAVANTIALTLFGMAGAWTLGMGVDTIVVAGGAGAGQWLSAAPVALVAAACFGARLVRDLRDPSTS